MNTCERLWKQRNLKYLCFHNLSRFPPPSPRFPWHPHSWRRAAVIWGAAVYPERCVRRAWRRSRAVSTRTVADAQYGCVSQKVQLALAVRVNRQRPLPSAATGSGKSEIGELTPATKSQTANATKTPCKQSPRPPQQWPCPKTKISFS